MPRYIDADDLRQRVLYFADARNLNGNHEQAKAHNHCLCMIDEQKTADVREVIPCEDCKHSSYFVDAHTDNYGTSVKAKVYCRIWQDWVPPEGYCFSADRKGETDGI